MKKMSAKNLDSHKRWRNITVGFRVSAEENELINKAVKLWEYGDIIKNHKIIKVE